MPKTILLADDSSTIRKIVELTFHGTEIRVVAFGSGGSALRGWERVAPDLILADVVMPEPNGYDLCRQVKASDRPVPVVLLSSTFEPYDSERAAECGADRHLIKPFESAALAATVRELLKRPPAAPRDTATAADRRAGAEPPGPVEDDAETDDAVDALIEEAAAAAEDDGFADELDERLVDAVSRAVVRRLSEQVVREIAREVVPDLAEQIIRERIRQLESEDS